MFEWKLRWILTQPLEQQTLIMTNALEIPEELHTARARYDILVSTNRVEKVKSSMDNNKELYLYTASSAGDLYLGTQNFLGKFYTSND